MLIEKLQAANIITKQARDDADVLIVETAIEESKFEKTAVIIGQDIDLLVILIGRTLSYEQEIFFKKVGKGNVKTEIYSTKSFDNYPHSKTHILFLHALSGCDTTLTQLLGCQYTSIYRLTAGYLEFRDSYLI